jgi:hypothetical protein
MHHMNRYRWLVGLGVLCAAAVTKADEGMKKPQICERAGVRVNFATSSSDLNSLGRASLDDVATWMAADPQRSVRVDGYTDPTGSESFNKILSEKRAESAKAYLVSKGAPADKIEAVGHGENVMKEDYASARVVAVSQCEPLSQAMAEPLPPVTPPPAEPAPIVVVTPPAQEMPAAAPPKETPASRIGLEALVGGGVSSYWNKGTRAVTDAAGTWDARLGIGSRSYIAGEIAYIGSAQNITALGLASNALLVGNGAEGLLRVNFTKSKIQPYVFGGVGYTNYQVTNTNIRNADINDNDNTLQVPFGAGLSVRPYHSFLLDIRGTGRVTYFDDLFARVSTATGTNGTGLNSWTGSAHLGWEF